MLKDSVFGFVPGLLFGTRLRVSYIISELMLHKQQGTWRWQYPCVKCDKIIASMGWEQGFTQNQELSCYMTVFFQYR